jgi:hypothetical protein
MTVPNPQAPHEEANLSERQLKAIPFLVTAPTYEAGRKKARVSKNALYEWLRNPAFINELRRQRNQVATDALEALKGHMMRAVETLVGLLQSESETLRRGVANDVINLCMKTMELQEIEERLAAVEERVTKQRR